MNIIILPSLRIIEKMVQDFSIQALIKNIYVQGVSERKVNISGGDSILTFPPGHPTGHSV